MAEPTNVDDDQVVDDVVADDQADDDQAAGADPYANLTPEQLKERLAKAEKAIVKNKRTEPKPNTTSKPDGDKPDWAKQAEERDEKALFGEEHNLSRKQVDAAWRYAGGKPDEETLASPEVQAMIKALGSKDRVAANTPKGGNAPVYKGKTFAEVTSDKAASKDDKKGAFDAVRKKHGIA